MGSAVPTRSLSAQPRAAAPRQRHPARAPQLARTCVPPARAFDLLRSVIQSHRDALALIFTCAATEFVLLAGRTSHLIIYLFIYLYIFIPTFFFLLLVFVIFYLFFFFIKPRAAWALKIARTPNVFNMFNNKRTFHI